MRILFCVSDFPVRSETFILRQIGGLLDGGHEVEICANEVHDAVDLHADFARHRLLERTRRRRHAVGGTRLRRVVARAALAARYVWREPLLVARCVNVFRYGRKALSLDLLDMALRFRDRPWFDVVHCHFGPNGNDAALLLELGMLRGRLVVTFHSYDVLAGLRTKGRIYRRLVRRADAVHCISEYNRRALEALGFPRERIHYQPMGIRLADFAPGAARLEAAAPVRILTVARLAPAKGLEHGLEALARLYRESPEVQWRYRVIGGGELRATLERRATGSGIAARVEFLGAQDQAVVRRALAEADIFLLPSLAEALPIAIMEALAMEVPVVATDVGGVAELVRDGQTGRLVPPGDAAALERALRDLIAAGPGARRRLGANGRRLVRERHDTDAVTRRLIAHYRELTAGSRVREEREAVASGLRASATGER